MQMPAPERPRRTADCGTLPPPPGPDEKVLWCQLSEDTEVRAVFTGRPTQEAIRKFIALLEISVDAFPPRAAARPAATTADHASAATP